MSVTHNRHQILAVKSPQLVAVLTPQRPSSAIGGLDKLFSIKDKGLANLEVLKLHFLPLSWCVGIQTGFANAVNHGVKPESIPDPADPAD